MADDLPPAPPPIVNPEGMSGDAYFDARNRGATVAVAPVPEPRPAPRPAAVQFASAADDGVEVEALPAVFQELDAAVHAAQQSARIEGVLSSAPTPRPRREHFDHPDAYDDAMIAWSAGETARHIETQREKQGVNAAAAKAAQKVHTVWSRKLAAETAARPDFAEVVNNENLRASSPAK